jgi:hypothetical protein
MAAILALQRWWAGRRNVPTEPLPDSEIEIDPERVHGLHSLQERGAVRVEAAGSSSMFAIVAEIRNRLPWQLQVEIEAGTFFVASGVHQDMVVIEPHRVVVPPSSVERVPLNVACMSAGRPVPRSVDRFRGVARSPESLVRFLHATPGASRNVIQSGVWAVSNDYGRDRIRARMIEAGLPPEDIASDEDMDEAMAILDALRISHRLSRRGGEGGAPLQLGLPVSRPRAVQGKAYHVPLVPLAPGRDRLDEDEWLLSRPVQGGGNAPRASRTPSRRHERRLPLDP